MPIDFATRDLKAFYQLQPGEAVGWWKNQEGSVFAIVVHPDHEPKVVYPDGREEILSSYLSEE